MAWHYQVIKHTDKYGTHFEIAEVFTGGMRTGSMKPYGESRAELIRTLERMLKDAKRYRTLDTGEAP